MNIYAVSVVQNEADVIRDSIEWASRFCEKIWVWDLGSTDGTWDILEDMASEKIIAERHDGIPFTSSVKGRVYNEHRDEIEEGAWVYILDADEFLADDPAPVLQAAEQEDAELVGAWQANFLPTPAQLETIRREGEDAWLKTPLAERLTHYRVEWFEWRFIRISEGFEWDTRGRHSRWSYRGGRKPIAARQTTFVRHYRYRSPQQVADRHETRTISPPSNYGQFRYDASGTFADYVLAERKLRAWRKRDEPFSVPASEIRRARIALFWLRLKRKLHRTFSHRYRSKK